MRQNPGAPFHQVFNRPRVWIWLFAALGLDDSTSEMVGAVLELGMSIGLWWIVRGSGLISLRSQ